MDDQDFINKVVQDMKEYETHAVTSSGDKFAVWFASKFLDLEAGEVVNKFHIGASGDEKVDLGIVDERFPTKLIIQCKYSENPLTKTYGKNEVDEAIQARSRIDKAPDDGNERRRQFVQDFKGSKLSEKLIIVGFGKFSSQSNNNAYEYARRNNVQVYDFGRLKKEYLRIIDPTAVRKPEAIKLPKNSGRFFPFVENDTKAYFMVIPAKTIYELVKNEGDGIFEENLRYQLPRASVSSLISNEIQKTLRQKPLELVVLNNGVTFVCERVEQVDDEAIKLIKPQIINGCQSSYAIHEVYDSLDRSGESIDSIVSYLSVKIIETDITDSGRIEKISRAANLQNPITPRNRYSNDELQVELKSRLGTLPDKIFYDHKDGSWESVERNNMQSIFKVPSSGRGRGVYRKLNNQLVGQIYLSLVGKPQIAGNQKGVIFSDEKYYNTIFNYKLPVSERFSNIGISPSDAMLDSGEDNFIEDILFGFRVYKLLDAIELELYPKKKAIYKDEPADPNYQYYKKVVTKEFVTYWHFHVIRLLHEIIYTKASGNLDSIKEIRKSLVTDEVDLFFSTPKVIAKQFNIESNPQKYTILKVEKPSEKFSLFGKWTSNLEQIVYDVISPEKEKPDWKGFNQFFYKREATLNDIRKRVTDVLGGADSDLKFPV